MPMNTRTLAAVLLFPLAVMAQPAPLLNVVDPEGDDVGDGSLLYPRDSAFSPGDVDLRSLRAFAEGGDLRFEATFRNPIRDPASVRSPGAGNQDLSVFSRRGFYAFNLDIYLDTDRVAGSGNTATLPGRGATLDPANGWEKAIVLTPRPELMKRLFIDALSEASPTTAPATVEATVDRSVYFPTQVRVRGRTVSFIVPGSFVDAKAIAGASLTAIVTLAKLAVEADVTLFNKSSRSALERLTLGAAQPEPGRPLLAMGYSGSQAPATAVVDLLSPNPGQQAAQLAPGALLSGLNRDNQMGAAPSAATTAAIAARPVAANPAPAAEAVGGSWFSRALGAITGLFGAGAAAQPAPAAANPQSLQSLMATPGSPAAAPPVTVPAGAARAAASAAPPAAAPAAPTPAAVVPAPQRPRDAAYFEEQELRLRTLKRLRDGGLITEQEYQQKRKEVLEQL
jgi:C-terminal binding-module, SLH-like, of glucodextranase/Short C-terminal domain